MITVTLLGSGGGMPMPQRFLSSLIIQYKGRKILVDCGEGTQVAMRKVNTGFKSIDIICITHIHGDHLFGLPGLLMTMGNSDRHSPVTIIGCEGISEVVKGLMSAISYLPFELNIIENPIIPLEIICSPDGLEVKEHGKSQVHEIIISTLELEHSSPCLGYGFHVIRKPKFSLEKATFYGVPKGIWGRLQNGEAVIYNHIKYEPSMVLGEKRKGIKISFITDTRPIKTISTFIQESDLFICEGTYGDNNDIEKAIKNKHMTFQEAAKLAKEGDVKELLLTHFSTAIGQPEDYRLNAQAVFNNTIIGVDGLTKTLSF